MYVYKLSALCFRFDLGDHLVNVFESFGIMLVCLSHALIEVLLVLKMLVCSGSVQPGT